jgi:hypothetical protein
MVLRFIFIHAEVEMAEPGAREILAGKRPPERRSF